MFSPLSSPFILCIIMAGSLFRTSVQDLTFSLELNQYRKLGSGTAPSHAWRDWNRPPPSNHLHRPHTCTEGTFLLYTFFPGTFHSSGLETAASVCPSMWELHCVVRKWTACVIAARPGDRGVWVCCTWRWAGLSWGRVGGWRQGRGGARRRRAPSVCAAPGESSAALPWRSHWLSWRWVAGWCWVEGENTRSQALSNTCHLYVIVRGLHFYCILCMCNLQVVTN